MNKQYSARVGWQSVPSVLVFLACAQTAVAAQFFVTKTDDTADGECGADCSLREAIIAANDSAGLDTVMLPAGSFVLGIAGSDENLGNSGDLDILDDLTIVGDGTDRTTIDGNRLDRVFHVVNSRTGNPAVTFFALSIVNGEIDRCGGAIKSRGDLTLIDVVMNDNRAQSGGALCNRHIADLADVSFDGNSATQCGGAIDNSDATGFLLRVTISSNTAGQRGGAICNDGGSIDIDNSTVASNEAAVGGALWNSVTARFFNATIAGNATVDTDVALFNEAGTLSFVNSILDNRPGLDCSTVVGIESSGNNIESGISCGLVESSDRSNMDSLLGVLADNGGATLTMLPRVGSPTIDAGNNSSCPATDQRNELRPLDGNNDVFADCDIGSVEARPRLVPISAFALSDPAGDVKTAVMADSRGDGRGVVNTLETGELTSIVKFSGGFTPVDAAPIADLDGDGLEDIALLTFDAGNDQPRVELRNPVTRQRIVNLNFNRQHRPVALDILPDQDGNQVEEAAVLATRTGDGQGRVLVRDLLTKAKVSSLSLPKIFEVRDLVAVADFSGNGDGEVLVLAQRKSDQRNFVLVWDTGAQGKLVHVRIPIDHDPVDFDYLHGPGGAPAVAVLVVRNSDQRGRVLVYDARTTAKLWTGTLADGHVPVALEVFAGAAGAEQVAVLGRRAADERPVVRLYDGDSGAILGNIWFQETQLPLDLVITPDTSLDLNDAPEIAVLTLAGELTSIKVRDSLDRKLIQSIDLPSQP